MALWTLIDGYNLIRQSPLFGPIDRRDMEEGRKALLEALGRYRRVKRCRITVVFDGPRGGMYGHREERNQGIEVVFTRAGETADDVIKRMASRWKEAVVVVTSDREVARVSGKAGAVVVASSDFEERMRRALFEDLEGNGEEEGTEIPSKRTTRKKGPSWKASKERRRALLKLRKL